jgi:hypothetical protein
MIQVVCLSNNVTLIGNNYLLQLHIYYFVYYIFSNVSPFLFLDKMHGQLFLLIHIYFAKIYNENIIILEMLLKIFIFFKKFDKNKLLHTKSQQKSIKIRKKF